MKTETELTVEFVAAKTTVALLQERTIPRLELLSALLLSKLTMSVSHSQQSQIPHMDIHCYTDSKIVFFWIHGENNFLSRIE